MTIESLAHVKANLSRFVDSVESTHERVVITRNGRPAALLVSVEDWERLEETLAVLSDPAVLADLAENAATNESFSLDQVRAEFEARRRT
ncbi:MAG: type II toxin-antitoxin system Phd/YefM family antitoxin [Kineosporiaceae bacterium]